MEIYDIIFITSPELITLSEEYSLNQSFRANFDYICEGSS